MFDHAKYVVIADEQFELMTGERREHPIVFPDGLMHSTFKRLPVVSAGFCTYSDGEWRAFGRSDSLNIGSRETDSELLNRSNLICS